MSSGSYFFPGGRWGDAGDYGTKRRWKVHTGEGPDRNREGGERKDLFKRGRYHGLRYQPPG